MDFSKRLKILRNEKGISQEELARLLGVSRASVTNYELGRNEASTQVLNRLSEIFNCSIDYLLRKNWYSHLRRFKTNAFRRSLRISKNRI